MTLVNSTQDLLPASGNSLTALTPLPSGGLAAGGPIVNELFSFSTKAAMDAFVGIAGMQCLLTDPAWDMSGKGLLWEWNPAISAWRYVPKSTRYFQLGDANGAIGSYSTSSGYTLVPFPTTDKNGNKKIIPANLYRSRPTNNQFQLPEIYVRWKFDMVVQKNAGEALYIDLRIGGISVGELFTDFTGVTLDGTNGSSIIGYAEWWIHPNNPTANTMNFDTHNKLRFTANAGTNVNVQTAEKQYGNWGFPAVADAFTTTPIVNPEIKLYTKQSVAHIVYFDQLLVEY